MLYEAKGGGSKAAEKGGAMRKSKGREGIRAWRKCAEKLLENVERATSGRDKGVTGEWRFVGDTAPPGGNNLGRLMWVEGTLKNRQRWPHAPWGQ